MDDDWPDFPWIGGQGSLHDLNSESPEPRLWFAKSVSPAAARALNHRPSATIHPIGFHTRPKKPPVRRLSLIPKD